MSPVHPAVGEDDLIALVDGELDPHRRDAVLRHLATCVDDQAKVEAWRQQNARLRAAFAPVAQEPLPLGLSFAPRASGGPGHVAETAETGNSEPGGRADLTALLRHPVPTRESAAPPLLSRARRRPAWLVIAAFLAFGIGAGGAYVSIPWPLAGKARAIVAAGRPEGATTIGSEPEQGSPIGRQGAAPSSDRSTSRLADSFDAPAVAHRIRLALARYFPAGSDMQPKPGGDAIIELPSAVLAGLGLELAGAVVIASERGPLGCFSLHGEAAGRLVLCIGEGTPAGGDFSDIGTRAEPVIVWQRGLRLHALAGGLRPERMIELAHRVAAALDQDAVGAAGFAGPH